MTATEHFHSSTHGPCARPVQLAGTEVDASTGEVLGRKTVERRCGSRLASQCPSCSALYAADARALIRAGLTEPGTGRPLSATFVTLTAPGANVFGQVHPQRRSGGKGGKVRTCRCGRRHRDGDPLLGFPLDDAAYRYDLAASYNAAAGRLAAVTWQKLGRVLGERLRVVRVMEYQARGLVHVHALVIGTVTQADMDLVVSGGTNPRTGRRIAPVRHGRWSWGPRCHARPVRIGHADRLGAYMSKVTAYAVKAAGEDRPSGGFAEKMARAGAADCAQAAPTVPDRRSIRRHGGDQRLPPDSGLTAVGVRPARATTVPTADHGVPPVGLPKALADASCYGSVNYPTSLFELLLVG